MLPPRLGADSGEAVQARRPLGETPLRRRRRDYPPCQESARDPGQAVDCLAFGHAAPFMRSSSRFARGRVSRPRFRIRGRRRRGKGGGEAGASVHSLVRKASENHCRVHIPSEGFLSEKPFHLRGRECKMLVEREEAFVCRIQSARRPPAMGWPVCVGEWSIISLFLDYLG